MQNPLCPSWLTSEIPESPQGAFYLRMWQGLKQKNTEILHYEQIDLQRSPRFYKANQYENLIRNILSGKRFHNCPIESPRPVFTGLALAVRSLDHTK